MERLSVIVLVILQVAQLPQREAHILDFLGSNHFIAVEGSWEQSHLLLNDREAVLLCYDDDVSNDSHFSNQVDY